LHGELNDVVYASLVILGSSSDADAVVATIEFTAVLGGTPRLGSVELVAESSPLVTKLTDAATAVEVIPQLHGPAIVGHAGDGDSDGDVDLADYSAFEACYGTGTPLGDCCCFDFDRDDDVDCDDWGSFVLAWTEVDPPPDFPDCVSCLVPSPAVPEPSVPDTGSGARVRYLAFSGGDEGILEGVRVTYGDGWHKWVGQPRLVSEISGQGNDSPPNFWAATLQCDPFWVDWTAYADEQHPDGVIHVYGQDVVPGTTYDVQLVQQDCETSEQYFSSSLSILTSLWGDAVLDCSTDPCGSPQGTVNFDDISAVVAKFKNSSGAPAKARVDLGSPAASSGVPDQIIDFVDIPLAVDAFRGVMYPFPAPQGCP
jgi:hypothetical protein